MLRENGKLSAKYPSLRLHEARKLSTPSLQLHEARKLSAKSLSPTVKRSKVNLKHPGRIRKGLVGLWSGALGLQNFGKYFRRSQYHSLMVDSTIDLSI